MELVPEVCPKAGQSWQGCFHSVSLISSNSLFVKQCLYSPVNVSVYFDRWYLSINQKKKTAKWKQLKIMRLVFLLRRETQVLVVRCICWANGSLTHWLYTVGISLLIG